MHLHVAWPDVESMISELGMNEHNAREYARDSDWGIYHIKIPVG